MSWPQRGAQSNGGWAPPPSAADLAPAADDGDLLWNAVEEAVKSILPFEKEFDENALQKKIRVYFTKGAKNLNFRTKPLMQLIDEYADNVFGSIFASIGDREWLLNGKVDFILVMDAGIKENFPKYALNKTPQHDFEQMVLAGHDRAFEEQRFAPILTEAVNSAVQGPKTRKRVWNALEVGRKEAQNTAVQMEDYAACWINTSIASLSAGLHGDPESALTADAACSLFHALIEGGGLPMAMTLEAGPPPEDWSLIDEAVQTAYITHTAFEEAADVAPPPAKKRKSGGPFSAF